MSRILISVVLLAACGACSTWRPAPWTSAQTVEALALVGAIGADAATSAAIIAPGRCHEDDPVIRAVWGSRYPTGPQFALSAIVGIVGALGVAELLPGHWRDAWLLGLTGVETALAVHNAVAVCGRTGIHYTPNLPVAARDRTGGLLH